MKKVGLLVGVMIATLYTFINTANASYTKTKYPIVLVHGLSGFDSLGSLVNYFHTVPYNLRRSGAKVYVASVSSFNSSEERGSQLAGYLMTLPENKFNLVGHSQGSPTSRVAAALVPHKVASVTSVNGANLGSKVADVALGLLPEGSIRRSVAVQVADGLGEVINFLSGNDNPQASINSAITLSTAGSTALNNALANKGLSGNCRSINENVNIGGHNIKMYSWSGTAKLTNVFDVTDYALTATGLAFGSERNDGLVSECSSKLGRVIYSRYHMNHLDGVNHLFGVRGWTNPVSLYRSHANRLRNSGL